MALRDASNLAEMEPHLSPHGARSVGKIGADTYSAASFGAAAAAVESAEEEAPVRAVNAVRVNAVHAHSEFWLPALKLCAAELGWEVDTSGELGPADASMVYLPPGAGRFAFMQAPMAQRFPGMRFATRKVSLARCFSWVQSLAPGALSFSPQTWLLPDGLADFEAVATEEPAPWLILKPDAGCRGRGIQLCHGVSATKAAWAKMDADVAAGKKTDSAAPQSQPEPKSEPEPELEPESESEPEPEPESEPATELSPPPAVVQRYLSRPWLWDGAKWDLRLYVLITSVSPNLEAFIAPTALARCCSMDYEPPSSANAGCDRMHLSNTSVNDTKKSDAPSELDNATPGGEDEADGDDGDAECKRTLGEAWAQLQAGGVDTAALWKDIRDNVVSKTLECMLPALQLAYEHSYAQSSARGGARSETPVERCFQVLGFDVMIDHSGAPHILEVNHNPSFAVPTDLDVEIKGSVMLSALSKVFNETPRPSSRTAANRGGLSMLPWEPVGRSPPDDDATQILRELKVTFDELRLPAPRVARGGGAPPPRTGPPTIGKVRQLPFALLRSLLSLLSAHLPGWAQAAEDCAQQPRGSHRSDGLPGGVWKTGHRCHMGAFLRRASSCRDRRGGEWRRRRSY